MTQIKITQADRDRAAELANAIFTVMGKPMTEFEAEAYLTGNYDTTEIVQAFAQHRLEAEQQMMGCFREMLTALAESCTLETIEEQGAPA